MFKSKRLMVESFMTFEQKSKSFVKSSYSTGTGTGVQYLLFSIQDDLFAVPVEIVNQIEFYDSSKKVPGSPKYVLGITKLRDKIVTIIHLARRLKMHNLEPKKGENHVIFIEKGSKIIGMLVDRVSNIINIPKNLIKEDIEVINTGIPLDFLKGVATIKDKIVVVLNIDLVLSNFVVEEMSFKSEKFQRELGDNIHSKSGLVSYDEFESDSDIGSSFDQESYETDESLTDELYDTEEEEEEGSDEFDLDGTGIPKTKVPKDDDPFD